MDPDTPLDFLASELLSTGAMTAMLIEHHAADPDGELRPPWDVRDDAYAVIRNALATTAEQFADDDMEVAAQVLWHALEAIGATLQTAVPDSPPNRRDRRARRPRGGRRARR